MNASSNARDAGRLPTAARDRAITLIRAADAAAQAEDGMTSAMGLYLRAMRADPTFCDPIRGITALLRNEHPELLETVLWRRLAVLDWSGETVAAAGCATEMLIGLYKRELRHRERARALQKLAATLERT